MRTGFFISLLLHIALLGWGLISISNAQLQKAPELEPVAVDLITPSEYTKLTQGARNAKEREAKEVKPEKPDTGKQAKAKLVTPPPPPPPAPRQDPDADKLAELSKEPSKPSPEDLKRAEDAMKAEAEKKAAAEARAKAEAEKKAAEEKRLEEEKAEEARLAEEQRQAEEAKKAAEKKAEEKRLADEKRKEAARKKLEARRKELERRRLAEKKRKEQEKKKANFFDVVNNAIQKAPTDPNDPKLLVNRDPRRREAAAAPSDKTNPNARGPALGAPEGRDRELAASEIAMLALAIKRHMKERQCWIVQGGGVGAEAFRVKLRIRFRPDGTLATNPELVGGSNSPFYRAAAENAISAVRRCEPFVLPADKYTFWQDVILNFDPREMF